jgi:hypothetical protein
MCRGQVRLERAQLGKWARHGGGDSNNSKQEAAAQKYGGVQLGQLLGLHKRAQRCLRHGGVIAALVVDRVPSPPGLAGTAFTVIAAVERHVRQLGSTVPKERSKEVAAVVRARWL